SSPLGPWTYKGQILSSSDEEKGPGHHAILQIPGCDDYYVIYHRWENGDFNHGRATAIDRMYFNADASISRIVMTNEGVKPRTVNGACSPGNLFLGGTYKLTHRGTNQCLDVDYNSNAPLANVQQYNDNGNDAQRWVVTLEADGFYKLTHKGTNQCLDVSYNSASPGANVQQYTDNGGDAQRWKLEAMNDGYYKVTHKGTNQCLDAVGNSPNPGEVIQYTDNGNNAQRWKFDLISSAGIQNGGVYQLAPRFAPSKRLDVTGGSNVSGTNVGIWEKNNAPAQAWQFIDVGNGYYELIPQCATNSRLDVTAGNNANGTNVQIWYGFANTPAQQWRVILRPDGYYELEPRNAPGKRLDVAGERGESGANVDIWQSFGNLAQQWKLLPMNNNDARLAAPEILEASSVNLQAYPNPFSQQVTLSYTPLRTEPVSVVLYNSQGGLVQRVFEGEAEAGVAQKHILQGGSLKAGMYVVKLATSAGTFHRKIMVVR
ncbi:MAG: RICIN domain-containing protein, partial [Bacteroidota bacterium]